MCCKVMGVVELEKEPGVWCQHCQIGKGCGVYETRPATCREYECIWLQHADLPDELRPDRCKVVLTSTTDGEGIVAHVDPKNPEAVEKGLMGALLKRMGQSGMAVMVVIGTDLRKILYSSSKTDAVVAGILRSGGFRNE
jgi:hypothetical protein